MHSDSFADGGNSTELFSGKDRELSVRRHSLKFSIVAISGHRGPVTASAAELDKQVEAPP